MSGNKSTPLRQNFEGGELSHNQRIEINKDVAERKNFEVKGQEMWLSIHFKEHIVEESLKKEKLEDSVLRQTGKYSIRKFLGRMIIRACIPTTQWAALHVVAVQFLFNYQ